MRKQIIVSMPRALLGAVMATAAKPDADKVDAEVKPATEFEASGAPHQIVSDVDPSHPAVDNNPRAGTSVEQNKIDFNDPTLTGAEAVAKNLKAQD